METCPVRLEENILLASSTAFGSPIRSRSYCALYGLIVNLASGMNSGYAIVVTQRFGAHAEGKLREAIAGMMKLDLLVTAILTVLSLAFLKPLMRFMNVPDAIFAEAYSYIAVICAGMASTICYNMFAGILRAVGNSRTSLYFLIISSLLNMGMDVALADKRRSFFISSSAPFPVGISLRILYHVHGIAHGRMAIRPFPARNSILITGFAKRFL